jgi:TatD DNase family protein
MLIDTHAHINFSDFDQDRRKIIEECLNNNIWMINVATDYETSKEVALLSQQYPCGVYGTVGVHPENIGKEEFEHQGYKNLVLSQREKGAKIVAVGEIGLDYWRKPKTKKKQAKFKEEQKNLFQKQLILAKDLDLPLIIHCRKAHSELLEILEDFERSPNRFQGVIHCFTGSWSEAERYLALGFYLGFNGIIFRMDLKETIRKVPQERMLVETDCPFLIPPLAEKKFNGIRNDPRYLNYIVEVIAKERGQTFENVAEITSNNAKKLFKLAKG